MKTAGLRGIFRVFLLLAPVLAGAPAVALAADTAKPDKEVEIKARTAFVAGRYTEAADLYAQLYGATLHPVYLRNLGRCHQKLGNAERAIEFFHDYLKKGQSITPAERREIDGYLAEMEALKTARAAEAASKPAPLPAAAPMPAAAPPASSSPTVDLTAPAAPAEATPVYERWWFWTAIGVAAAGGATAILLSRTPAPNRPACAATECL